MQRHWFVVLTVLTSLLWISDAKSQQVIQAEAIIASSSKVFTHEEKAKARQELMALADIFGVEMKKKSTPETRDATSQTPETTKNMADIADKALNMVTQLVGSISATLEQVSPEIWIIFVRQQYAHAISQLIVPWSMVLLLLLFSRIVKKNWKYDMEENFINGDTTDWPLTNRGNRGLLGTTIPYVIGFFMLIWGCNRLADSVPRLINPQFYAVKDLLQMLLNPGSM